ncbi:hypothetical protein [Maridesulfovibrio sp.]|uniref:hypothetical protein n=1 Tax=Maridesulfovibrio sp. TaxID=2795000 RepID=UPI002A187EE9|nr:hypothetical protein [Maridesulfovibrio sp.]
MKITKYYSPTLCFILALFLVTLAGCASINPFADSVTEYDLDGKHNLELDLMPGDEVAFEMRNPGTGGYQFDGVVFDPKLVSLDKFRILDAESGLAGDFGRWRFKFTVLDIGDTIVAINIKRPGQKQRDAYKVINMSITKDGPPFFKW